MKGLTFFAVIVGALVWAAVQVNQVAATPIDLGGATVVEETVRQGVVTVHTPEGNVYLSLGAGGSAVIMDGELTRQQGRSSFSSFSTPDHTARLNSLRKFNAPPPAPKGPDTVVIVNQQQSQTMTVDRRRHNRRQRHPRQAYSSPMPGSE